MDSTFEDLGNFAASPDCKSVVFATPRDTRKYRLLRGCDRVALVIDRRPLSPDQIMDAEAVTATGQTVQVPAGAAFDRLAALLTSRHRQLTNYVADMSNALFRIDVEEYVYVTRFQEVHRWCP